MHCRKPCHMDGKQGDVKYRPGQIMCRVDCLLPYHLTSACVKTNLPSLFSLAGCLCNLSSEYCGISTQNCCHMDLGSV